MDITTTVSDNIKRIREQKKLTLDAAAAATGVSRSRLAQIERGAVNPTISVLWKIASGFKVPFTSLVENRQKGPVVIPADSIAPLLEDGSKYVNYPIFTFEDENAFESYRIVIAPEGKLEAQPHLAGSAEYITVFLGSVEITAGDSAFLLHKGDSIRFSADVPHSYRNPGQDTAELNMIIHYPSK